MNNIKMKISEVKVEEPFKTLFLIHSNVLSDIKKDMEENGFDPKQPITIWRYPRNIVIDGHTRLEAARQLGFEEIPVDEHFFADQEAAVRYAIKKQRNRRSLNSAQILHFVEQVDKLFQTGGDRRSNFWHPKFDLRDSRKITAELLGISTNRVSECRHIIQNSDSLKREIEDIKNGVKGIHEVYKASLAAQKRENKKKDAEHERWEMMQGMKLKDYPSKLSKEFIMKHDSLKKLIPSLRRQSSNMAKIKEAIEFFSNKDEKIFKILFEQILVQEFLGSLFVNDFISVLTYFGYKIEKTVDLKVIVEKRQIKKKRPAPPPHCSAARFNEPGFISNAYCDSLLGKNSHIAYRDKRKKRKSTKYYERQAEKDMLACRYG